eukprot:1009752-Pleurochrysis_carterae.AAC.1
MTCIVLMVVATTTQDQGHALRVPREQVLAHLDGQRVRTRLEREKETRVEDHCSCYMTTLNVIKTAIPEHPHWRLVVKPVARSGEGTFGYYD